MVRHSADGDSTSCDQGVPVSPEGKSVTRDELQHIALDKLPPEPLNPLITRQFVHGSQSMLARILLRQGAVVPRHSHHNEQITYVLSGALRFHFDDGREIVVRAGETLVIPPHMPHAAEALEDTIDLDVFAPPREDWINGTDAYLRGK
ncbi:MAG TPA: cupin domain-containing protein [Acidobacterium sp.]|nr:cupin domain-containing protein [Acidobacterium sp.]